MNASVATIPTTPPIKPTLYQPRAVVAGITLRPMVAEDELVFRRLYAEVRSAELSGTPWDAAQKQAFCDSQYTLQDQHYRHYYADFEAWAICTADAVIGRMYLATFEGLWVLMDITLTAAARGEGIGSQLLCDVMRQADAAGRSMSLHVEPTNPARRLYQRLGFIETADADAEIDKDAIYLEMRRLPRGRESLLMPDGETPPAG